VGPIYIGVKGFFFLPGVLYVFSSLGVSPKETKQNKRKLLAVTLFIKALGKKLLENSNKRHDYEHVCKK
jgi:hypothetical protein